MLHLLPFAAIKSMTVDVVEEIQRCVNALRLEDTAEGAADQKVRAWRGLLLLPCTPAGCARGGVRACAHVWPGTRARQNIQHACAHARLAKAARLTSGVHVARGCPGECHGHAAGLH